MADRGLHGPVSAVFLGMHLLRRSDSFEKWAKMKLNLRKHIWIRVACLSLWPALALAQSSDLARNLDACKAGRDTCNRPELRASACDYSKLTPSESKVLADSEHKGNYASCVKGYSYCDRSRLTSSEANAIPAEQKSLPRQEPD